MGIVYGTKNYTSVQILFSSHAFVLCFTVTTVVVLYVTKQPRKGLYVYFFFTFLPFILCKD